MRGDSRWTSRAAAEMMLSLARVLGIFPSERQMKAAKAVGTTKASTPTFRRHMHPLRKFDGWTPLTSTKTWIIQRWHHHPSVFTQYKSVLAYSHCVLHWGKIEFHQKGKKKVRFYFTCHVKPYCKANFWITTSSQASCICLQACKQIHFD